VQVLAVVAAVAIDLMYYLAGYAYRASRSWNQSRLLFARADPRGSSLTYHTHTVFFRKRRIVHSTHRWFPDVLSSYRDKG
jgi:hypothetical protein